MSDDGIAREPLWEQLDRAETYRLRLLENGYFPLPCVGKVPTNAGWQQFIPTVDDIKDWKKYCTNAVNTGVLCAHTPVIDVDVRDAVVADEVEALVEDMIGEALLTRFGARPKRCHPFRTAVPFGKLHSGDFVSPDSLSHHVEVLAGGQQFVAFGKHPDTGQDYEWVGGSPLNVPRDQLPELTETKAREIIAAVAKVFRRHGWVEDKKPIPEPKPRANRLHSSTRERRYAEAAVGSMATELSNTMEGSRNDTLNKMAFKGGRMVGAGWIARDTANAVLLNAALESGLSETEARRTLQSGLDAGEKEPHPGLEQTIARKTAEPTTALEPPADTGAEMLSEAHAFLTRFVSYPSVHAAIAHALWCVHAHLMHLWDTTPRLAFLSPEPASGKSRALEVTKQLVPKPVWAVNVSSAYLFRKIGQEGEGSVTLLYDEIDAVFGPKAKENEDTRALLNAGHRKGAVAGRCVARGTIVETEEIPAYAALAVAGLGWLPDTLMSRSIVIRMRPRHSREPIEPYRPRLHDRQGEMVYRLIEAWAITQTEVTWPDLPEEIKDRDADCWEPLIAVADAAGGEWPALARRAAKALIKVAKERETSLGVRLLMDTKAVFDSKAYKAVPHLSTKVLLQELISLEEAPWSDLRGKPLSERGLAHRLREYSIRSQQIRIGETTLKGYKREAFFDAWKRYAPSPAPKGETSETNETTEHIQGGNSSSDPTHVSNEAKLVSDRVLCVSDDVSSACARTPTKSNDVAHVSHVSLVGGGQAREKHKCEQCNAHDGTEGSYTVDGRTIWLHAGCVRFWLAADGKGRH